MHTACRNEGVFAKARKNVTRVQSIQVASYLNLVKSFKNLIQMRINDI